MPAAYLKKKTETRARKGWKSCVMLRKTFIRQKHLINAEPFKSKDGVHQSVKDYQ